MSNAMDFLIRGFHKEYIFQEVNAIPKDFLYLHVYGRHILSAGDYKKKIA